MKRTGMWGMFCWNSLSTAQQERLIEVGNLPMGYREEADGPCDNGATVEITTCVDWAPGPRFYCTECAIDYLKGLPI